ncbi:MAG: AraC family transcriptional regulator [Prevotellaceae bacterium]|nr:AraC family transcriptional regulator [Prevotellaceae bacterium]
MNNIVNMSFAHFKKHFWYGETNLDIFLDYPYRLDGGFFFLCTAGEATLCHDVNEYHIRQNTESILLPDSTFYMKNRSADFNIRLFTFSKELFDEVSLELGFSFSEFLRELPFYGHTEENKFTEDTFAWLNMAELISNDIENRFLALMQRNFLQSYLMYLYERIRIKMNLTAFKLTRKQELFHQFMSLLSKHCREQRNVRFYAAKLNITSSYLYKITRESTSFKSPKNLIDKYFILEIKILLQSPKLTISEIAYRLGFPNESYFCRYFKRHTGMSPKNYRAIKLNLFGC